jgi:hypothetical protein
MEMKKLLKYFWFLNMLNSCIKFVTEDEGGNDDDDKGGKDDAVELATLKAELAKVSSEREALKGEKTALEQRVTEADEELLSEDFLTFKETLSKSKSSKSGDEDKEELDLDRATNREIVQYLTKVNNRNMEAAVKELKQELNLTKQQLGMVSAQADVSKAELLHNGSDGKPSFESLHKEIYEVAKSNPTWNAEKCYKQVLIEQRETENDKEIKRQKELKEEEELATERSGVPRSASKRKDLSKEEAADIAYRKAFGNKD